MPLYADPYSQNGPRSATAAERRTDKLRSGQTVARRPPAGPPLKELAAIAGPAPMSPTSSNAPFDFGAQRNVVSALRRRVRQTDRR